MNQNWNFQRDGRVVWTKHPTWEGYGYFLAQCKMISQWNISKWNCQLWDCNPISWAWFLLFVRFWPTSVLPALKPQLGSGQLLFQTAAENWVSRFPQIDDRAFKVDLWLWVSRSRRTDHNKWQTTVYLDNIGYIILCWWKITFI